jgi:uncharacterized protein YlzI (FlbEa/FlbD family)
MKLIKLTTHKGSTIYLNPSWIVSIKPGENWNEITTFGFVTYNHQTIEHICVRETAEEIIALINQQERK